MTARIPTAGDPPHRFALAPGLFAAIALLPAVLLIGTDVYLVVRFLIAVLALIVAWFAATARHWWWIPPFTAIAVLWNPAFPITLPEPAWIAAHYVAAAAFAIAGVLITTPSTDQPAPGTANGGRRP